jgi:hypothetical protein
MGLVVDLEMHAAATQFGHPAAWPGAPNGAS